MMSLKTWVRRDGSHHGEMAKKGRDSGMLLPDSLPIADTSYALLQRLLALPACVIAGHLVLLQPLL